MHKKICIVASAPSGIVSFWKTNISKLSNNFDVYVVANYDDSSLFSDLAIKGCKSISIERRPSISSTLKAVIELTKYFNEEKFDGFISMSSNASLIASIAGRISRIPFRARIFTGQVWALMTGVKRVFYKTIDRLTVFLNTHILVDGKSQQEYLISNGIFKINESTVLANGSICGVDVDMFKPNIEKRNEERNSMGFKDADVVFVFMGRINRDKGTYELLDAFNMLAKDYHNAKLMFIGNNEGIDDMTFSKYEYIRYNDNLFCYGYTTKPFWALQAGDVFCLPSYREGFGMSVIEAAALSMPVIVSDAYGLRDSFVDGVTGKKCIVKNAKSLYDCMKFFYDNPQVGKSYGAAGRQRIINMFSMDLVSSAWLDYVTNNIN